MPENVESLPLNDQKNSENSENIQENPELNTKNASSEDSPIKSDDEISSEVPESDEPELPEPDISEEESKKRKEIPDWMKKKLERERAASAQKEAEALALKEENERLKSLSQSSNSPQTISDPNIPRRDQYNTEEEYFFALHDYRDTVKQQVSDFHKRQAAIEKSEREYHGGLKACIEKGKEKYSDFEEKTHHILYGQGFPTNRAMGEAIVSSEYGDDILCFLGTNLKLAEEIAHSNPILAVKEIAKIEARFAAKKRSNISKAAKPLVPLQGNKGSATHSDPGKMEMEDFTNWYKQTYS